MDVRYRISSCEPLLVVFQFTFLKLLASSQVAEANPTCVDTQAVCSMRRATRKVDGQMSV